MYIVKITDGLGNQIFQYAFAKKLQMVSKSKVYLDTRYINNEDLYIKNAEYKYANNDERTLGIDKFRLSIPNASEKELKHWNYIFNSDSTIIPYEKLFFDYTEKDKDCLRKLSKKSKYFKGYYFDLNYYDDIKKILQREICLREPVKCNKKLYKAVYQSESISVHIRRGDFLKVDRDISTSDYYLKAIEYMENRIDDLQYIIFSDDSNWVKEHIKFPRNAIFVSDYNMKDYEEMMLMKHCKHNIIANSTFSYWGAYLNKNIDKIVIAPKGWKSSIIPETWVKI